MTQIIEAAKKSNTVSRNSTIMESAALLTSGREHYDYPIAQSRDPSRGDPRINGTSYFKQI